MSLSDELEAAARRAGDEATLAGIEARRWEILLEWRPDRAEIVEQHRLYSGIAATKAGRAQKLAARAAVPETTCTAATRAEIVAERGKAAERQELLDEKAENADVWGLTDDEVAVERARMGWDPASGKPAPAVGTPAQLRVDAMMGRAWMQALSEWIEVNPDNVEAPEGESTTPAP